MRITPIIAKKILKTKTSNLCANWIYIKTIWNVKTLVGNLTSFIMQQQTEICFSVSENNMYQKTIRNIHKWETFASGQWNNLHSCVIMTFALSDDASPGTIIKHFQCGVLACWALSSSRHLGVCQMNALVN